MLLDSLLPVVTGFLGALLAYLAQRDLSKREREASRSERDIERFLERGEELYSLIERWQMLAGTQAMTFRRVMLGELDYNQAFDLNVQQDERFARSFERIDLILRVYFQSLTGDFAKLKVLVSKTGDVEAAFREKYKEGQLDGQKFLPTYEKLIIETEREAEDLLNRLSDEIRKHCGIATLNPS
ncbi:hypothetical protein [uncultured Erythrobacter sp.]|uniref:hypothetical protein n=1 Tax=uncultured Erythrobacter sp. TaxID=263913 RepID=UPI0026271AEA|nr:hypothetical protein [uncultured Erythrobacter sp.]